MKAYIEGAYGPKNIGDDVLMTICIRVVERHIPREHIAICVQYPEIAAKWFPGINWLKKGAYSRYNADILLHGGGGLFNSFPLTSGRGVFRYSYELLNLVKRKKGWHELFRTLSRRMTGNVNKVPVIEARHKAAFCIGVGPFVPGSGAIDEARRSLSECDFVSVRDPSSKFICDSWGLQGVAVRTDPCFMKDLWFEGEHLSKAEIPNSNSVAFVFRAWAHSKEGQRYFQPMIDAASILRVKGVKIKFISLDKEIDRDAISLLAGEDILFWEPSKSTPSEFIADMVETFSLVVSARAHGIMLPATFGTPGICVAIEPKLKNIHDMLPSGTLIWQDPFLSNDLVEMVEHMLVNRKEFMTNVVQEVAINRAIARQAVDELSEWIKNAIYS